MSGKNSAFLNNNPPTVDDVWLNMVTTEIKNFITDTDQIPSDADLFQICKGVANAVSVTNFYVDSGIANAYVLTPVSPFKAPDAYRNGMEIRFRAGNANSGASTVNVDTLGIVAIKKADGITDVVAGEIPLNQDTKLRFNGSIFLLSSDFTKSTIKTVNTSTAATSSGITPIPFDNTRPQQGTEGDEYMSLSITAESTTNSLLIEALINYGHSSNVVCTAALFQDATANALCAVSDNFVAGSNIQQIKLSYWIPAIGTILPTTFKIRCGGTSGTFQFNGVFGSGARFNGAMISSMTITEYKA